MVYFESTYLTSPTAWETHGKGVSALSMHGKSQRATKQPGLLAKPAAMSPIPNQAVARVKGVISRDANVNSCRWDSLELLVFVERV